ncbi:MAG: PEP-CTERM sorting domain-containing protein [Thiobacillus sp.]
MRALSVFPVLLLSLAASMEARAVTVSLSDLPLTVLQSGDAVNLDSSYSFGGVSAFATFTSNSGWGWLMRYDMAPPSGQTDIDGNQTAAYDGYLWMHVQNSYSAAATSHAITLYRDKITPASGNLFGQNDPNFTPDADANGDLSLFLTTADLLAGNAYRTLYADFESSGGIDAGNLQGELPVICLATGCAIHAEINLVQLQYQLFGSTIQLAGPAAGFNPIDTRGLVYRQSSGYSPPFDPSFGSNTEQTFAISAVPEPNVLAMLGCGLGMVAFAARRRRT